MQIMMGTDCTLVKTEGPAGALTTNVVSTGAALAHSLKGEFSIVLAGRVVATVSTAVPPIDTQRIACIIEAVGAAVKTAGPPVVGPQNVETPRPEPVVPQTPCAGTDDTMEVPFIPDLNWLGRLLYWLWRKACQKRFGRKKKPGCFRRAASFAGRTITFEVKRPFGAIRRMVSRRKPHDPFITLRAPAMPDVRESECRTCEVVTGEGKTPGTAKKCADCDALDGNGF